MEIIDFESLVSEIKKLVEKRSRTTITFHSIADTDSVSSAIALSSYIENSRISVPDRITPNSKRIMKDLGFDEEIMNDDLDLSSDVIILVDVNNFDGCGSFRDDLERFGRDIIIIDHHLLSEIKKDRVKVFNDEKYCSTASIIYDVLKKLNHSIEKNLAKLIAIGIISDSAEFKNSSPKTFLQLAQLLEISSTDYPSLIEEIKNIGTAEQRELTIRSLFSSNIELKDGLLFVTGSAKSNANIAADMAIRCNADLALFYSVSKHEVSFSARMRPPLDKKLGLHLGRIMKNLAQIIDGSGGGHPCAAGAYGNNTSDQAVDQFIKQFGEVISTSLH